MNTPAEIYTKLETGALTGKQAVDALVAQGMSSFEANQNVFFAIGGDDVIEIRADGKEYYANSGKSVEEVSASMGDLAEDPQLNDDD